MSTPSHPARWQQPTLPNIASLGDAEWVWVNDDADPIDEVIPLYPDLPTSDDEDGVTP